MQIILILFLYLYSVILFILWLKRPYNWETGINVDHNSTAVPYLMPLQQTKPLWCSHTYQPNYITKACVNCSVLDRGLLIQLNLSLSTVPSEYGHIFHTAGLFFWSQRHQTSCTPFVHMTDISIMRTLFLYPFVFTLRSLDCMQKFFLRLHRLFVVLNLRSMPELRVLTVMFTFP